MKSSDIPSRAYIFWWNIAFLLLDIYPYQKSTKSPSKTHTQHAHTKKKLDRFRTKERHMNFSVCVSFLNSIVHLLFSFFIFCCCFFLHKKTRATQQKKIILMSKSDALATKEMPFRVYMGYDSHEDITFEVRATRCSSSSSIRRTTSSVFVASRIVYCACVCWMIK